VCVGTCVLCVCWYLCVVCVLVLVCCVCVGTCVLVFVCCVCVGTCVLCVCVLCCMCVGICVHACIHAWVLCVCVSVSEWVSVSKQKEDGTLVLWSASLVKVKLKARLLQYLVIACFSSKTCKFIVQIKISSIVNLFLYSVATLQDLILSAFANST